MSLIKKMFQVKTVKEKALNKKKIQNSNNFYKMKKCKNLLIKTSN